eukprot:jgi/Botrbrau1/17072/Bobra.31_2s0003.1
MLNASGGVSQLQKVKVLEDDSGPVRLNIRFQKPSVKPAAGAKQKAAKPAAESDDEEEVDDEEGDEDDLNVVNTTSRNTSKPYTDAARIAFSLYGPRDKEGKLIGKADKRFKDETHQDHEFLSAREPYLLDVYAKIEQAVAKWYNDKVRKANQPEIPPRKIQKFLNRR